MVQRRFDYVNLPSSLVTVTGEGTKVNRGECFHHWTLYRDTPLAKGLHGTVFSVKALKATTGDEFVLKVQNFKTRNGYPFLSDHLRNLNNESRAQGHAPHFTESDADLSRIYTQSAKSEIEIKQTSKAGQLGVGPELIDYWKCAGTDGTQLLFMVMRKVKNAETFNDFTDKYGPPTLSVLDEIGCAIEKLHSEGVYHLDLHGSNLLFELVEEGVIQRVWIIDYGAVARDPDPLQDYAQLSIKESDDVKVAREAGREHSKFGEVRYQLYLDNRARGREIMHQKYLQALMSH